MGLQLYGRARDNVFIPKCIGHVNLPGPRSHRLTYDRWALWDLQGSAGDAAKRGTTARLQSKHMPSIGSGKRLPHRLWCPGNFPGNSAAARDISRIISAHAFGAASRVRFALRLSGCLGSDHGVVARGCLDSKGSGLSLLLWRGWAVFCCGGGLL